MGVCKWLKGVQILALLLGSFPTPVLLLPLLPLLSRTQRLAGIRWGSAYVACACSAYAVHCLRFGVVSRCLARLGGVWHSKLRRELLVVLDHKGGCMHHIHHSQIWILMITCLRGMILARTLYLLPRRGGNYALDPKLSILVLVNK